MTYEKKPADFNAKLDVVSCFLEHDGEFLLLHRQDNIPQGDTWGVPAGKKKAQETPLQAMRRELEEETGITTEEGVFGYFREVYVKYPEFDFVFHIFYLRLTEKPEIRLNPSEHKAFVWVRPHEALRMKLIPDEDCVIKLFYKLA